MYPDAYNKLKELIEAEDKRIKKTIIYRCFKCKKKITL